MRATYLETRNMVNGRLGCRKQESSGQVPVTQGPSTLLSALARQRRFPPQNDIHGLYQ